MRSDTIKKGFDRVLQVPSDLYAEFTTRFEHGWLAVYARLVTSADTGAILEL